MSPPPEGANISNVDIIQNGAKTTTISVSSPFDIVVTAEFGNAFPSAPVTVKVVVNDVMLGYAVVFVLSKTVNPATLPNTKFTFNVPVLPLVGSGDICPVNVVLVSHVTANPNEPPLTSTVATSFVAF
jgi:hypothetical protein